jgi:hypothetical protein
VVRVAEVIRLAGESRYKNEDVGFHSLQDTNFVNNLEYLESKGMDYDLKVLWFTASFLIGRYRELIRGVTWSAAFRLGL